MKYLIYIIFTLLLTGCAQKSLEETFIEKSKDSNINYKTLMAICYVESGHKKYAINVNESLLNFQKGPHFFDTWIAANSYMDFVLDPLFLSYDVGICQINNQHLKKFHVDNEDLLDPDTNIEIASKIYKYNINACNGNVECALSMYNTGQKKSVRGTNYAKKVIATRKKMFKE